MEPECGFKADDSMRYTLTGEDNAMFEVERPIRGDIESPADFRNESAVDCPPEYLVVDAALPKLRQSKNSVPS
jgi:hypothetical protein